MWPFRKKPAPPRDLRNWNEDWRVGDTAEVVPGEWNDSCPPWRRLPTGERYVVTGFKEGIGSDGACYYFLALAGLEHPYSTQCFRKVRPVSAEQSEVAKRILDAPKVGPDRVREDA